MARPEPAVPGLADAVDELYLLPPADFTARRDELAKQARADGGKALAAAVKRLRRPTVSAWAVNLLVREEPDLVEQLLQLGGLLREAQQGLDGPALKELDRQRRGVVGALARRAAALAGEQGQRLDAELSRQVEQSLGAALADPDAASAVASGQLTKPLDNVGFGVEVTPDAVAVPGLVLVGSSRRRAASTEPRAEASDEASEVPAPESLDDARARRQQAQRERARQEEARQEAAEEKQREQARKDEERREKERRARATKARAALEQAQAQELEAAETARRAAAELDDLRAALDDLRTQRDDLAARLADAEQQVAEATDRVALQEQQQTETDATLADATQQLERAEHAVRDAEG